MSKKQREKLLSSLNAGKKFHSTFGASILSKYGWKEGQGLGKSEDGIVQPVSVMKADGNSGLGACSKPENEWHNWWDDMYNNLAAKIDVKGKSVKVKKTIKKDKTKED